MQGVGFRFTTHRIAGRHNVKGFVRNLPDGTVEVLGQGPGKDVESFVQDVRRSFEDYIRDVNITDIPPDPRYDDFKITY